MLARIQAPDAPRRPERSSSNGSLVFSGRRKIKQGIEVGIVIEADIGHAMRLDEFTQMHPG
jgi:hypothetical protein